MNVYPLKFLVSVTLVSISLLGLVTDAFAQMQRETQPQVQQQNQQIMPTAEQVIQSWPATPQKVAREMMAKYGQPNEATPTRLIWFNNGPWKRTIVYREEIPHHFPKPHTDLLEQVVNYTVRPEKFDDLAAYDGSVIVERTKGEISARCDKEAMNFLALNLANDIVTGRRTVNDARRAYAENAMAFMQNKSTPYTQGLQFSAPKIAQGDPDVPFSPAARAAERTRIQGDSEIEVSQPIGQPIRGFW